MNSSKRFKLLMFWISYSPTKEFDKSGWQKNRQERYQMAEALIKSNILINKDTIQVKHLLGEKGNG